MLEEGPTPLMPVRRYPPYHEMAAGEERRRAVVELHADGWTAKAIAGYLKTSETTVYRALKRWFEGGVGGLEDKPRGRPKGSGKVTFPAMNAVRLLQQNPALGAFRVHAALKQMGIHLSRATCGRIMAENRRVYGLEKPRGGAGGAHKRMLFASKRRHEYWSADVRYLDTLRLSPSGQVYAISVLENHSRAILASGVFRTHDLSSFLSVFHRAVERYEVEFVAGTGELRAVAHPRLFETPHATPQPKLFALDALGDGGWLKALRLEGYAPRGPRRPSALQEALFPFSAGWG